MKRILFLLLFSALFIFTPAQSYTVDLRVQNVAEMDFAPFLFSNNLSGSPRIFAVQISPEEGNVKVRGELFWKKDQNSAFEWVITFRTKVFQAQTFFNTDLGTKIKIGRNQTDSDLIDLNRERGKPTGEYRLDIYLLDENNNELGFDSESYIFENPAQTLSIISPQKNSIENIGGVTAQWDALSGIQYYEVLANVREDANQSLEDALESGEPVINNANVGMMTSVDLRTLLTREWLPGQEIVFRVSALPLGGNPNDMIESNIVNFHLDDPSNPTTEMANENIQQLLQSLPDDLGSELLDRLLSGDVKISEIVSEETGLPLSPEEIQDLLNYLRQNPDNLIKIEQD